MRYRCAASRPSNQNAKTYGSTGTATTNVKVMILMTHGYNQWANISSSRHLLRAPRCTVHDLHRRTRFLAVS